MLLCQHELLLSLLRLRRLLRLLLLQCLLLLEGLLLLESLLLLQLLLLQLLWGWPHYRHDRLELLARECHRASCSLDDRCLSLLELRRLLLDLPLPP